MSDRPSDHRPFDRASSLVPPRSAVVGEFSSGADFISSIVAGLLLGLGLDWLFSTSPVLVVIGIVAGFASGFVKMWRHSAVMEAAAEHARRHGTQTYRGEGM